MHRLVVVGSACWLLLAALLVSLLAAVPASAQTTASRQFDHATTGYPLAGAHAKERCESCHRNAVFKGTPKDCASCHIAGARWARDNTVMPARHVPTSAGCDSCHDTRRFAGARFSHAGIPPGSCQNCHNGSVAAAKPRDHLPTTSSCDTCHTTGTWAGARPDHAGFTQATSCASCHNGSTASGKPATHVPVGATNCFSCHGVTAWKPSRWNHTQVVVTAQCASCHNGAYPPAEGKPSHHIPYTQVAGGGSANCDTCHKSGTSSWNPGLLHANLNVTANCASCHNGSYLGARGKPADATHANASTCENCHTNRAWTGAQVDHAGFNQTTNCASCHNGSNAPGKPASHIPVGLTNCHACHGVTAWKPSKWNHTQVVVTAQCASCHTGSYPPADGKPANHIPYALVPPAASANCDGCHKSGYASWNPGRFHPYYSVGTSCSTCHTGSYLGARGKPPTPIHNGVTACEQCHNTTSWSNANVDHGGFNQNTPCASCHNGVSAPGKPATHIPAGTTSCYSCHGVTAWKPSKWNHTQVVVTAQCASCHTGSYPPADGKPGNHVPYQLVTVSATANCDACHKSGYGSWNPGRFHAYFTTSTQCATCHAGAFLGARGKPADAIHTGVTTCESCHKSTSNWASVQYQHAAGNQVGSGTCDGCHNGNLATGKPAGHIPVQLPTVKCDGCHRSQASWATAVTTNHSLLGAQPCKSCHLATYVGQGLQAKPTSHIPEAQLLNGAAMDCKACHPTTTSWSSMRMNHNGSQGAGAGWCKSCHSSGTNYLGDMERKSLTHEARSRTPLDCSESGCHRPLGTKGKTYVEWD
jgi:hypothetical protein